MCVAGDHRFEDLNGVSRITYQFQWRILHLCKSFSARYTLEDFQWKFGISRWTFNFVLQFWLFISSRHLNLDTRYKSSKQRSSATKTDCNWQSTGKNKEGFAAQAILEHRALYWGQGSMLRGELSGTEHSWFRVRNTTFTKPGGAMQPEFKSTLSNRFSKLQLSVKSSTMWRHLKKSYLSCAGHRLHESFAALFQVILLCLTFHQLFLEITEKKISKCAYDLSSLR